MITRKIGESDDQLRQRIHYAFKSVEIEVRLDDTVSEDAIFLEYPRALSLFREQLLVRKRGAVWNF